MTTEEKPKEKETESLQEKKVNVISNQQEKTVEKKKEEEIRKNQIDDNNRKFEGKIMKYFGNEFFERRLEIPPKRSIFEPHEIDEDFDKIIPKNKILRSLIHFEKKMDEKIFKTRLDIQEQILRPKNMIKAILRMHIFAFSKDDENSDETNFILNIQGKIMDKNENNIKKYRKFSHYFKKIQIKFDEEIYPDIEWENPAYIQNNQFNNANIGTNNYGNNNNINQMGQMNMILDSTKINNNNAMNIKNEKETDVDCFSIKRPAKEENMKIKILLYIS